MTCPNCGSADTRQLGELTADEDVALACADCGRCWLHRFDPEATVVVINPAHAALGEEMPTPTDPSRMAGVLVEVFIVDDVGTVNVRVTDVGPDPFTASGAALALQEAIDNLERDPESLLQAPS